MNVSRLAGGIVRFESSLCGLHEPVVGYAVAMDSGSWALVDPPGDLTPDHLKAVVDPANIRAILLTHVQAEHGGGVFHFPQVPVHVPAGDEYLCRGMAHYLSRIEKWKEPWDWSTRGCYEGHVAGAANERPLSAAVRLGEPLIPGRSFDGFRIVATPGHGKNSVSLLREMDGKLWAFCGDLVFGNGQIWNWFDSDWDYGLGEGYRTHRRSCDTLASEGPHVLLPAHGPPVFDACRALGLLGDRLARVTVPAPAETAPRNFAAPSSPAEGFEQLTPHLFQWRTGNTAVLVSESRRAVVIDDGLCLWLPLADRIAEHDRVVALMKERLGIVAIDWIFPTHYHGDHTEFIPRLAEREGARVAALASVCGPMEFPHRYNLACSLPWYDSAAERLSVDLRVEEGFELNWEEYSIRFFHLGGQTRYHQGLDVRVDGRRVLFVGDAWFGTSSEPAPIPCWNDADPADGGWLYGIERMLERKPDLLVCGHGSAIQNPVPLLREAHAAWLRRMEDFAALNGRRSTGAFFRPFATED